MRAPRPLTILCPTCKTGRLALESATESEIDCSFCSASFPVIDGVIDVGNALSALGYDDDVYLSNVDGTLADATGTVDKLIGNVVPGFGATTPDKLLAVRQQPIPDIVN